MYDIKKTIVEDLQNGNDQEAREDISRRLENMIEQSENGDISLAGFVEVLAEQLEQAKIYITLFKE